jgi:hypothetical protein
MEYARERETQRIKEQVCLEVEKDRDCKDRSSGKRTNFEEKCERGIRDWRLSRLLTKMGEDVME